MTMTKASIAAVLAGVLLLIAAPAAAAQEVDTYDEGPDQIADESQPDDQGNNEDDRPGAYDDDAPESTDRGDAPESTDSDDDGSLPVTGGDLAGLAVIGGVALAGGVVLTWRRRETS